MLVRFSKYMVLFAALACMVPFSAWARSKNQTKVVFSETVEVGKIQLKPGTYDVRWEGNNSSLHVNFLENGKVVGTAQGKMIEKEKPSNYDQTVMSASGATKRLEEIDLGGKRDALIFKSN